MNKKIIIGLFSILLLTACSTKKDTVKNEVEKSTPKIESITEQVTGNYTIDNVASIVRWEGKKVLIKSSHNGTIAIKEGKITIEKGKLSAGSFTMDMTTIQEKQEKEEVKDTDNEVNGLEKHLKSADFFDVEKFPISTLNIKEIKPLENNEYQITADLTIKKVTKPVEFKASINFENGVLKAKAKFDIDRTLWGIKYNSGKFFKNLGDKVIDDKIGFDLDLSANKS